MSTSTALRPCPRCLMSVDGCDCPPPLHLRLHADDGATLEVYGYPTGVLPDGDVAGDRQHAHIIVLGCNAQTLPDADRIEFPDCTGPVGEAGAAPIRGLMWMVLDQLQSAGSDPDEWWGMRTSDLGGLDADRRAVIATEAGRQQVLDVLREIRFGDRHADMLNAYADLVRQGSGNGDGCLACGADTASGRLLCEAHQTHGPFADDRGVSVDQLRAWQLSEVKP